MRLFVLSLLTGVLIFICGFTAFAQVKHPFTFEDMMKIKRVGEPEVSPDGKWVIFSVVDVNLDANTKMPHIWIVPTAGGPEREIIADRDADRPRWAPDGKRFAFISTKEQGSQIWIADFDGAQIFTRLLYRHWNAYKEGKRSHIFVVSTINGRPNVGDQLRPVPHDLTPGDYDAPVFSLDGQDNYAFSPDGKEICYTSNHDKNEANSTNNDIWIIPVRGGANASSAQPSAQARNITADNPASDSTPLYSPDGRYIAYRAQQRPGYESDRFRLMLYDRKTGEKTDLTQSFDHWVGSFVWAPDSKTIYFSAEHLRHSLIYAVGTKPVSGTANPIEFPRRALVGGFDDDVTVTPDGKELIFTRMSLKAPIEIYAADATVNGCPARTGNVDPGKEDCSLSKDWALTHTNDKLLSQISMSDGEPFSFTGAHGDWVEGTLVKPPNFEASTKYPVKFLIHGGPQGAWGDDWSYRWNPELFAANGYLVIMINFHGSTGYGQKFIDAINGDWGGAPYEDLMKGLDYAEKTYPFIDKDRECALGASYGGYAINWILGHTHRFKCLVSHDGMFNAESAWGTTEELWFNDWEFKGTPYDNRAMYQKWSPHQYAKNFKTPTLVIHGQRDYRLDVSEGFQMFTTLHMEGVPSKMLYFPDEGHWVLKPHRGNHDRKNSEE